MCLAEYLGSRDGDRPILWMRTHSANDFLQSHCQDSILECHKAESNKKAEEEIYRIYSNKLIVKG